MKPAKLQHASQSISKYLVDTDMVIDYLKGKQEAVCLLQKLSTTQLAISTISIAELYEGVYGQRTLKLRREATTGLNKFLAGVQIITLDQETCQIFGKLRAKLRIKHQLIDNFDLFIAVICIQRKLTLITNNIRHFKHLPGLKIKTVNHSTEKIV